MPDPISGFRSVSRRNFVDVVLMVIGRARICVLEPLRRGKGHIVVRCNTSGGSICVYAFLTGRVDPIEGIITHILVEIHLIVISDWIDLEKSGLQWGREYRKASNCHCSAKYKLQELLPFFEQLVLLLTKLLVVKQHYTVSLQSLRPRNPALTGWSRHPGPPSAVVPGA